MEGDFTVVKIIIVVVEALVIILVVEIVASVGSIQLSAEETVLKKLV